MTPDPVVFSVFAQQTSFQLSQGLIVPFDSVLTDVGGNFFVGGNCFYCPQDGVYEFAVYLTTTAGRSAKLSIRRNGISIASTFANAGGADDFGAGGNSVISLCFDGEVVDVITTADSYLYGGRHLMFTGRLLFSDLSTYRGTLCS